MFFFAFQDFLRYYTDMDARGLDEDVRLKYVHQYMLFCKEHHMVDNIRELMIEFIPK